VPKAKTSGIRPAAAVPTVKARRVVPRTTAPAADDLPPSVPVVPLEGSRKGTGGNGTPPRLPGTGNDRPLPARLKERIKGELTAGEKLIWLGQPWDKAVFYKTLGKVACGLGVAALSGAVLALFLLVVRNENTGPLATAVACGVLGLFTAGGLGFAALTPGRDRRWAQNTLYSVTNRRAVVILRHPETPGTAESYYPNRLRFMFRRDSRFARGGGDLILAAETKMVEREKRHPGTRERGYERKAVSTFFGFMSIARVEEVEDLIRRTLVEPLSAPSAAPSTASGDSYAVVPKGAGARRPVPLTRAGPAVWEVPDHLRDRLDKELGRGERVVWAGRPSVRIVVLRCLVLPALALVVAALAVIGLLDPLLKQVGLVPDQDRRWVGWPLLAYVAFGATLVPLTRWWKAVRTGYVLTDRRALVWRPGFLGLLGKEVYRPDQLLGMRRRPSWVFGDEAGDVIFRSVTTITKTIYKDRHGRESTRPPSYSIRTVYYGFLAIYQSDEVERLIRETLLEPLIDGSAH
jgi:hypothetical protein